MIKTNKFQTPLTDEFLESLEKEEREQLLDYINNIKFIQNLISPERKRAKDLPRDEDGRIIIDLTNPHILEDMEYFRPTGNYYREHGKYTSLMPNDNPNSEFGIWFTTEINRIWHGMVRPSDGEWITGEMYYYLNYCPIKITKISKKVDSKSKSQKEKFSTRRITDFPEVWEGAYLMFHYLNQSRENNSHSALIARRGMGKSYMLASILSRIFTCGNNEEEAENAQAVITAFSKQFLISDGTLNKFVTMIDHCAKTTEFPRARYKSSLNDMNWIMGYIPFGAPVDTIEGSKNEVIGISAQNNADNSRGKRCLRFVYEEFGKFPNFLETWSTNRYSVQEGEYLFGQQIAIGTGGTEGNDFSGALEMIYHPKGQGVYGVKNVFDKGSLGTNDTIMFLGSYINSKGYYNKDGVSDVVGALLSEIRERLNIKYNASDPMLLIKRKAEMPITLQEAIMKRDNTIYPVDDLNERINQLDNNPSYMNELWVGRLSISGDKVVYTPDSDITPITHYPHQDNKLNGAVIIKEMPQKDSSGVVPFGRYVAGCLVEGELVDTNSGPKPVEEITLEDKLINIEGKEVTIYNTQEYNNINPVYTVKLANILDTTTFSEEHPIYSCTPKRRYNSYSRVKREHVPERYYEYNFGFKKVSELKKGDFVRSPIPFNKEIPLHSEFNTPEIWYLIGVILGDGWVERTSIHIAFNTKETPLIDRCKDIIASQFGTPLKTIKTRENCIECSFNHSAFSRYFTENFGKYAGGKYISPLLKSVPKNLRKNLILGYIDTDGCISNGSADVVSISKRLLCDIQDWLFSLNIVSSVKILRPRGAHVINNKMCPTQETYQLHISGEGLNTIKDWGLWGMKINKYSHRELSNHNRNYVFIKDGYIYLRVQDITTSPYVGKIYNFECETHTFMCNYIPTHNCDPYDDDMSNTLSLGSIYILDLYTDDIVFEYTGRPQFADDFYEICRRALLMYNARCNYENNKKGLFSYFSHNHCLHLLTDTLEFLKDKNMVKEGLYGNKVKGTNTNAYIKAYARRLTRDWLLKPVVTQQIVVDEDGVTQQQSGSIPNLYRSPYRALLQELAQWNDNNNFDRHDALGMLMLLRENELMLMGNKDKEASKEIDEDYSGFDSFFVNNCPSLKTMKQGTSSKYRM